jgi:hypothetical protein
MERKILVVQEGNGTSHRQSLIMEDALLEEDKLPYLFH